MSKNLRSYRVSSKVTREFKKSFYFTSSKKKTHIIALAKGNVVKGIDYSKKGTPLNGCCVYDAVAEKFYCECSDYLDLGAISISFFINVDKVDWQCMVPIPESVLMIFLNKKQKKKLKEFKFKNSEVNYFSIAGCD